MIVKSVVLPALDAGTERDPRLFAAYCSKLRELDAGSVEFFCGRSLASAYASVLSDWNLAGVFLLAGKQKKDRAWLCSCEETARRRAVDHAAEMLEAGQECGCKRFLLTSGEMPAEQDVPAALDALERSLDRLSACLEPDMLLTLEPGDRTVDARQLIGPTEEALHFIARCRELSLPVRLTMDASHCRQLGEEPGAAFAAASSAADHFHLANCTLDKRDSLFGDKHVDFDYPGGELSRADALSLMDQVKGFGAENPVIVGLEIINRAADLQAGAAEILARNAWFFTA